MYLRGLLLNNDARKAEAIEIFANALPEFARLIAIECDVKEGLEHDMVADYLLQHHHSALNMLNIPGSNQLSSFLALYKREHKITRQKECLEVVMERYFPTEVAGTRDSIEILEETPGGERTDTAEQAPASTTARGAGSSASTSKTPHVPPKCKFTTPAVAVETSQLQGNNAASEKISLGDLLLDKTDFVSALSLLEKDKKHKALVDALKATTSNLTPHNKSRRHPW